MLKATATDKQEGQKPPLPYLGAVRLSGKGRIFVSRLILFPLCSYHPRMSDMTDLTVDVMMPGQLLARGVCRHMASHGFVCIEEFVPTRGLRVDVLALGPKGELWVIECKSSKADFQSDNKWQGYLEWCDRYFWAVDEEFPTDLLPDETGLLIGDAYDAEIIRMAPESKLAAARRKVIVQKFAVHAARRLQALRDPMGRR